RPGGRLDRAEDEAARGGRAGEPTVEQGGVSDGGGDPGGEADGAVHGRRFGRNRPQPPVDGLGRRRQGRARDPREDRSRPADRVGTESASEYPGRGGGAQRRAGQVGGRAAGQHCFRHDSRRSRGVDVLALCFRSGPCLSPLGRHAGEPALVLAERVADGIEHVVEYGLRDGLCHEPSSHVRQAPRPACKRCARRHPEAPMSLIDWIIVAVYLIASLLLGLVLARRGSRSMAEFFVSGRSLPWWLAGTSMAATTFSIDTPLYVAGVVARQGVAGNWQWWSFAISHVLLVFVFARLWRRAEVITDAELIEIRYGGRPAAVLRALRAFIFAVPINVIGMGYAMLAARKVVVALGFGEFLPPDLPGDPELWAVVMIVVFTLVYAGLAGLWGVVATDFFQFFLALFGAVLVAIIAVADVGGLAAVRDGLVERGLENRLAFLPLAEVAQLSVGTFLAYIGIQWWAFRRSDGGGEFIQRLSASKDEAEAERAAWFFNILNYVVRTWPWVLVGLVALVVYPDLLDPGSDPEAGYPRLMLDYLPSGVLGLVVASLIAAFMSTVSTQINWGASYIANDLYRRFLRPDAPQRELVWVGRIASVALVVMAGWVAFHAHDVGTIFTFMIAIGTGPGAVLIL